MHIYNISTLAFSSDVATLTSDSKDRTIRLWDTIIKAEEATVASGSEDYKVRLWDITIEADRVVDKDSTTLPLFSIPGSVFKVEGGEINLQSKVSYQISPYGLNLKGEWIQKNRDKILWLPEEYRSDIFAFYKGHLVVGQVSEKVSFFEFDEDVLSLEEPMKI